jgi:hypothetical protein
MQSILKEITRSNIIQNNHNKYTLDYTPLFCKDKHKLKITKYVFENKNYTYEMKKLKECLIFVKKCYHDVYLPKSPSIPPDFETFCKCIDDFKNSQKGDLRFLFKRYVSDLIDLIDHARFLYTYFL